MALTKVIGAGLGAVTQDGGAVFNEASADVDFRVESDTIDHALFVDGATGSVGIGTSIPATFGKLSLAVAGTTTPTTANNVKGSSINLFAETNGDTTDSTVGIFGWQANTPGIGSGIGFSRENGSDWGSQIRFYTHPTTTSNISDITERMRIHSDGVVSASAGVALGVGTANTASNVLDDYEEGTFTPTLALSGATLASTGGTGRYTKIGRHVYVEGKVTRNTADGGAGSFVQLESLPFTSLNANSISEMGSGTMWMDEGGPGAGQGDTVGHALVASNGNVASVLRGTSSGAQTSARYGIGSEMTNGRPLYFNFVYTTA